MLLKWGQINRIVCLNNWLLSTNLYPHWEGEGIETTTSTFSKEYSSHGILFRSINAHLNRNLITRLKKNGYRLMPIRQVYIFDPLLCDYTRKQNFRWDARLLQQCKYRMVNAEDIVSEDYSRISELYNLLYIKKYSQNNPKFTSDYIKHCHLNGILELQGIRGDDGRLIGIVGSFDCGKVTTCPIVGYDTSISQKVGLYRMLMAMVMKRAAERGLILNLSAGAAHFKRIRGGKPFIEYIALYDRHLPFRQRLVWRLTALALDNIALPILQHYKL
jgi:hypothetical protein